MCWDFVNSAYVELTKVTGEWNLVCLALNMRRMWALHA